MNCLMCLDILRPEEEPRGMHSRCLRTMFGTAAVEPRLGFSRADITGEMLARSTRRMSISGVQRKLSLRVEAGTLQSTDTNGEYILKNISLWRPDGTGAYAGLAPNYDMLNTGLYLPGETTFALDLLAQSMFTPDYEALGYYTWADFAELARRIDLTDRAALRVRDEILERTGQAKALLQTCFLADKWKKGYIAMLGRRSRCLTT